MVWMNIRKDFQKIYASNDLLEARSTNTKNVSTMDSSYDYILRSFPRESCILGICELLFF